MSEKIWVIYDNMVKIKSQPLSEEQVQMSILRMNEKDWGRFLIWKKGWENWQPLEKFLKSGEADFLLSSKKKDLSSSSMSEKTVKQAISKNIDPNKSKKKQHEKTITKSMTRIRPEGEWTKTHRLESVTFDADDLDLSNIKTPQTLDFKKASSSNNYRERAERHELKIEILLALSNGKTFRSYSKNISLTGTILADHIPTEFYTSVFEVIVVNKYSRDFKKSRVALKGTTTGHGLTSRIQFEKISDDQKQRLTDLLEEYLSHQKAG